jgi:hypothetical protein
LHPLARDLPGDLHDVRDRDAVSVRDLLDLVRHLSIDVHALLATIPGFHGWSYAACQWAFPV